MRDIDRLLAKAQDLLDQAWRTAQTKREVIALVDAYHDVRRARANLDLALTPQPVKYRPPSRSRLMRPGKLAILCEQPKTRAK